MTVGGCAATRSAGQASTGYGRFDELVRGLRAAAPAGDLDVAPVPASAAGPSLRELLLGSEGTLGVLTSVTLHVRPAPAARRYDGVVLPDLGAGLDAFRALVQEGAAPGRRSPQRRGRDRDDPGAGRGGRRAQRGAARLPAGPRRRGRAPATGSCSPPGASGMVGGSLISRPGQETRR